MSFFVMIVQVMDQSARESGTEKYFTCVKLLALSEIGKYSLNTVNLEAYQRICQGTLATSGLLSLLFPHQDGLVWLWTSAAVR